jgi:FlaG/FlaF family flagellin (archaellin)
MSAFNFSLQNSRHRRFYVSAALAALIASVVVGAMEIYLSAPTDAAVVESQPVTAPSLADVVEHYQGVPRL